MDSSEPGLLARECGLMAREVNAFGLSCLECTTGGLEMG
jgi:hypothetical protein